MTATAGDDELPPNRQGKERLRRQLTEKATLNLWRVLTRASEGLEAVHFVGNLNVYVRESAPVERHMAVAIGLQAGMENMSTFIVGDGTEDSYTFRLEADSNWRVDLVPGSWNTPISGPILVMAVRFIPPADAERGRVAIWVRRQSTKQDVPVEFELAAKAPAAHCYQR